MSPEHGYFDFSLVAFTSKEAVMSESTLPGYNRLPFPGVESGLSHESQATHLPIPGSLGPSDADVIGYQGQANRVGGGAVPQQTNLDGLTCLAGSSGLNQSNGPGGPDGPDGPETLPGLEEPFHRGGHATADLVVRRPESLLLGDSHSSASPLSAAASPAPSAETVGEPASHRSTRRRARSASPEPLPRKKVATLDLIRRRRVVDGLLLSNAISQTLGAKSPDSSGTPSPTEYGQFPTSALRETLQAHNPIDRSVGSDAGDSTETASPVTIVSRWSTPCSWFQFPPEIRNMIYDEMLQLPTSAELYSGFYRQVEEYHRRRAAGCTDEAYPTYSGRLKTPPILLLCRAITAECLPLIRERTFIVDRIPPWIPGQNRSMMVSQFLGRKTLQALERIEIRLDLGRGEKNSGWIWVPIVEDLLAVLAEWDSLVEFRVIVRMFQLRRRQTWTRETSRYQRLKQKINWFETHKLNIWQRKSKVVVLEHWEVDVNAVYRLDAALNREFKIGELPNPELVPASITDFLDDP